MTTAPDLLRVGLIGYGLAGRNFHAPLLANCPGLSLAAVATSRTEAVAADHRHAIVFADPTALIASSAIDLVVIAAPNTAHAPLARAALAAGKPVVVDKPFTIDLDEARELAALAEAAKRLLAVFHNRRWDSDFLGVAAAIREGVLGRVTHFESHLDRFRPDVRDRWRERPGPGSGLWFDLGPHLADQALLLFGLPETVSASFARQRTGAAVDDWAHVVLRYGPLRVILHADSLAAGGTRRFTVHGEAGSLIKRGPDPQDAQVLAGLYPGAPDWGVDRDDMTVWDAAGQAMSRPVPAGDQRRFYAGVRDALRGDGPNPVPPIQAIAVMAVLDAAVRSDRSDRAVALALTADERAAFSASRET